jgi:hypothetical protein
MKTSEKILSPPHSSFSPFLPLPPSSDSKTQRGAIFIYSLPLSPFHSEPLSELNTEEEEWKRGSGRKEEISKTRERKERRVQ